MSNELTSERENELIDKMAHFIVKNEMSAPVILFLYTFRSLANLGGTFALLFIEPFLPFFEKEGHEYIEILGKTENIEILVTKIEKLIEKKRENKKELSYWSKIKEEVNKRRGNPKKE